MSEGDGLAKKSEQLKKEGNWLINSIGRVDRKRLSDRELQKHRVRVHNSDPRHLNRGIKKCNFKPMIDIIFICSLHLTYHCLYL